MVKKKKKNVKTKSEEIQSFEKSLADLENVVSELETGNLSLSDSLAKYEEGIRNLKICHAVLETAENRIRLLTGVDKDGNPSIEEFNDDASDLHSRSSKRSAKPPDEDPSDNKPVETGSNENSSDAGDNVDDCSTLF